MTPDTITIGVRYYDSVTNLSTDKTFTYSNNDTITQAQVVADIINAGKVYKAAWTQNIALQSKVGTVIVIP
ncbi:MAG: hypothetical protein KGI72_05130 [Patescibacteria group bacterium]|nr:hypothetical protein [Patescibacteria group bacterium]MDE2233513.1 hypothetical protein [Patescibacteria group bacterium]